MSTTRRGFLAMFAALAAAPLSAMGLRKNRMEFPPSTAIIGSGKVNFTGYRMYRRKWLTFSVRKDDLRVIAKLLEPKEKAAQAMRKMDRLSA